MRGLMSQASITTSEQLEAIDDEIMNYISIVRELKARRINLLAQYGLTTDDIRRLIVNEVTKRDKKRDKSMKTTVAEDNT